MQQKVLLIGNWKMNPATEKEAITLARYYKALTYPKTIDVGCAVPVPYVASVKKVLGKSKITLGLQNVHPEKSGAFTGEYSLGMVAHLKPAFIIVGHSERRALGETNAFVGQKVAATLKQKLTPIMCIGERERDPEHRFLRVVADQITEGLENVPRAALARIVIAYEPVWAIGKDAAREMTPEECREMIIYIKKIITDRFSITAKDMPKILYGGSVSDENARAYIEAGADGLLIGRTSLEPKRMQKLITKLTH